MTRHRRFGAPLVAVTVAALLSGCATSAAGSAVERIEAALGGTARVQVSEIEAAGDHCDLIVHLDGHLAAKDYLAGIRAAADAVRSTELADCGASLAFVGDIDAGAEPNASGEVEALHYFAVAPAAAGRLGEDEMWEELTRLYASDAVGFVTVSTPSGAVGPLTAATPLQVMLGVDDAGLGLRETVTMLDSLPSKPWVSPTVTLTHAAVVGGLSVMIDTAFHATGSAALDAVVEALDALPPGCAVLGTLQADDELVLDADIWYPNGDGVPDPVVTERVDRLSATLAALHEPMSVTLRHAVAGQAVDVVSPGR